MPDDVSRSLDALLARCRAGMSAITRRHGVRGDDFDDVFQQVRIRIWQALADAERIRRLPASYVYRTLNAVMIDRMRRRRARGNLVTTSLDEALPEALARHDPDPVESDEAAAALARATDALIASRRAVVRMYLDGYSQKEIGDVLGWSEPRTRNLLYRGLADLRQLLNAERTP